MSYQAAVDAATDAVTVAEQALDQATIASPIDGTVVAVNLAIGDSVTAASSTANVIVQGAGGYEVSTTVSVDDVPAVAVGQHATVVPDGSHKALTGTVVVDLRRSRCEQHDDTSYLVVIGLSDPKANLKNGSTGSVSIVTKSAALRPRRAHVGDHRQRQPPHRRGARRRLDQASRGAGRCRR